MYLYIKRTKLLRKGLKFCMNIKRYKFLFEKTWKSQLTVLNDLPDIRRQKKSFKTLPNVV